jgi:glycosyltransferase involved in cell wall biosynthesis
MKVSIITVAYNSETTIRDTIESVIHQTYANIEYIIIDGASTDNTMPIVEGYKDKIHTIISEPDKGLYDAMNKGIQYATGDVIGILNSDDYYENNEVIEKVVDTIKQSGADVCYADLNYVHPVNTAKVIRRWKSGRFQKSSFYYGWMPPHPTVFVKRQVYEKVGLFNVCFTSAADYEIILRIFFKNNFVIAYLPETIICMRTGGTSNASLKNRLKANKEDRMAWKINGIKPYFFTLLLKPFRKIIQYF